MNAAIALAILGFVASVVLFLFVWSLCRMASLNDAEIEYPSWLPEPSESRRDTEKW